MPDKKVPCKASKDDIIGLLPCSGACNVGMLTTRAVIDMTNKYNNINFVCSLGIPLEIEGIVNNAKKSDYYIAVNGCKVRCSSKALESINIEPNSEVILTEDFGIKKNKDFKDNTHLGEVNKKLENTMKKNMKK